jgi:hypothetical protein
VLSEPLRSFFVLSGQLPTGQPCCDPATVVASTLQGGNRGTYLLEFLKQSLVLGFQCGYYLIESVHDSPLV